MIIEEPGAGSDTILRVTAQRLDAAVAPEFKQRVIDVVARCRGRLLLDLSAVSFLDSSGLGALVRIHKHLGDKGPLEIVGMTPSVRKVFELTRMSDVFRLHSATPAR